MQALHLFSAFLFLPCFGQVLKLFTGDTALQQAGSSSVHLSNSNYLCLNAALPCSSYFIKFNDPYMQVVDRKGNQVQHTLQSYQVRYFNVWKELRTVEHQGNKLTEQALRYFDSREQGICIYIDKLIASNAVSGATVCVNGVSLWKL